MSADKTRQQEQDNMLPHVSTSCNSLYTDIIPHTHYLTQRFSFLFSQSGANLQRVPFTHQSCSKHHKDSAEKEKVPHD